MLESFLRSIGVYSLYEAWLAHRIEGEELPKHVGVILDGNRRWAKHRGQLPWEGHRVGAQKVEELIEWCLDLDIGILSLYVMSGDNFRRSSEEVQNLLRILYEKVEEAKRDGRLSEKGVRIKTIGGKERIPESLRESIEGLENSTADNGELIVNLALDYTGKQEIVTASKNLSEDVLTGRVDPSKIDQRLFEDYLYTSHLDDPDIDVVIRTSGERRLSDFLLWQSAYSELVFLDVNWPDFRKIDLMRAIRTYQQRNRRFGT